VGGPGAISGEGGHDPAQDEEGVLRRPRGKGHDVGPSHDQAHDHADRAGRGIRKLGRYPNVLIARDAGNLCGGAVRRIVVMKGRKGGPAGAIAEKESPPRPRAEPCVCEEHAPAYDSRTPTYESNTIAKAAGRPSDRPCGSTDCVIQSSWNWPRVKRSRHRLIAGPARRVLSSRLQGSS